MPSDSDEAIFSAALSLPAVEREAYLDATCAADSSRRARLADLLRAADEAPHFMEPCATEPPGKPPGSGL
jgi:hypothetical protein